MSRSILAMVAAGLVLGGCYQSHDGTGRPPPSPPTIPDGGSPDAPVMPPPPPSPPPPAGDSAFIIHRLDIPEPTGEIAPGANLDGRSSGSGSTSPSATCEEFNRDFRGLYDGRPGIDDAYGQLVPTIESLLGSGETVRDLIADAIARGELLLLLELTGTSTSPRAVLHFAAPLEPPLELGPGGTLAPDQRFVSVAEVAVGVGDARDGRTVLSMGDFAGPFPIDLVPILPFGRMEDVEMSYESSPDGLRRGTIGGAIRVEDGVEAAARLMPGIEDTVRSVLESIADLDPSAADPAICARISLGMTFEAVPAELVEEL